MQDWDMMSPDEKRRMLIRKRIMGMRDILSHHYFDIDAEIVHSVCV